MLCDPSLQRLSRHWSRLPTKARHAPRIVRNTPDPATHQRPHRRPLPDSVIPRTTNRYGCVTLRCYHATASGSGCIPAVETEGLWRAKKVIEGGYNGKVDDVKQRHPLGLRVDVPA